MDDEAKKIAERVATAKVRLENFQMMNTPPDFEGRVQLEADIMKAQRELNLALIEQSKWITKP